MDPVMLFDEPTSAFGAQKWLARILKDNARLGRFRYDNGYVLLMKWDFAREVSDEVWFVADGYLQEQGSRYKFLRKSASSSCRIFFLQSTLNINIFLNKHFSFTKESCFL